MKDWKDNFAVLILTNRRPNSVLTVKALKKHGYTGAWYLVVDDEDPTLDEYQTNYGSERVLIFDKKEWAKRVDAGDNFDKRNTVTYARNAAFEIARDVLQIDYFLELDDDYHEFRYRDVEGGPNAYPMVRDMNAIIALLLRFYQAVPAIKSLAIAQDGDYIGGRNSSYGRAVGLHRKVMNFWMKSTLPERAFKIVGRANDDVNTYVTGNLRGELFLTTSQLSLNQMDTQTKGGGLTGMYIDLGTYVKSFYTVMYAPSCTHIVEIGHLHRRLHHQINWNACAPKIVRESLRKT